MNPRSGGGKAERSGLLRECRARGIEPVVLGPGEALVDLAEAAVAGGADVLGMAGGDGSQALVGTLPGLLGPGRPPFDLRFTGPAGETHTGAHVVQVSNNPYGRTVGTLVSRPRLDTGHLGVIALELPDDPADKTFLAAVTAGRPERFPGYVAWTPSTFEVNSDAPINAGIDGEALRIAPPLRISNRRGALRIRLPRHASGRSPAARELRARSTVRGLRYPLSGRTTGSS